MKKSVLLMAMLLGLLLSACSAQSTSSAPQAAPAPGYDTNYGESSNSMELEMGGAINDKSLPSASDILESTDPGRKLIRRAQLTLETTDFEACVANLEQLCFRYAGYIEESSVSGLSTQNMKGRLRDANYVLRIPEESYRSFLSDSDGLGNLVRREESASDITDSYYDIEGRLQVLEIRQARLLALLETATDSEAIVNFELALNDTLYEIESMTGQLNKYDRLVSYTSITVYVQEAETYTEPVTVPPKGVGERIAYSFGESLAAIGHFLVELMIFLTGNILYLLVIAAIVVLLLMMLRRRRQNRAARAAEFLSANQQQAQAPAPTEESDKDSPTKL